MQARMNSTVVWLHAFVDTLYLAFVQNWNEPKGSTWFQKRLNLQGTRFLRYCHRFLGPLDGEVAAKTFQTVLRLARRGLFPSFLQMSSFAYFPQSHLFDAGPENCRTRWGKKSSGSARSPYSCMCILSPCENNKMSFALFNYDNLHLLDLVVY